MAAKKRKAFKHFAIINTMINTMPKAYDSCDVVDYVLALLPGEKINLSSSREHRSFHKLKGQYPDFFSDFRFNYNGHIYYSKKLENHIQKRKDDNTLELTWLNGVYRLGRETKNIILEELSCKFSEEEKSKLKEMSESLKDSLAKKKLFLTRRE